MRGWQISQSTYLTPSMHPELRLLPVPFLQANLEVNFYTLQLCTSLACTRNCKITCIYEESATACSNSYLLYPTAIAIYSFSKPQGFALILTHNSRQIEVGIKLCHCYGGHTDPVNYSTYYVSGNKSMLSWCK